MSQNKGKIFYFDATEVRREKMRLTASGVTPVKKSAAEVSAQPVQAEKIDLKPVEEDILPFVSPEPVAPAPSAAAPAVSPEELEKLLIAFVVEQTGYPEDMVDMSADLEGDLGIDSIKKAQLMGELNETFHFVDMSAPGDSDMSLDDFPTLGSIRDYLLSKIGGSVPVAPAVEVKDTPVEAPIEDSIPAPAPASSNGCNPKELEALLINFVVEQTGYPEDMVDMSADLEGDLGIDSIKKAQLMGELNETFHFVDMSAPGDSDMSLDDFPTLGSIRDYLLSKIGGSVPVAPAVEVKDTPVEAPIEDSIPAPAPASSNGCNPKELEALLINFVVEQTGYPEDMVDMSADLEGDLGIDSIKKAQLMGELNETFHFVDMSAPGDSDMSLDDFPTLGSIRDYLLSKMNAQPRVAAETGESEDSKINEKDLAAFLINFVVEQTGYPESMITLDADLQSELNIDSIKKAQLFGELSEIYDVLPLMEMSLEDFKTLRDILTACMKG